MSIIRNPTSEERQDFVPLATAGGTFKSPHQAFIDKLALEELKAVKSKLPFAAQKAKDDYKEAIDAQEKLQMKEFGYIQNPIKIPELDWASYSDLKNFTVTDEGETLEPATKSGRPARMVKYKVYKFKGYSNKYQVMED